MPYWDDASGITVGITSTQVLPPNPNRKHVTFVNDSAAIIYLRKGTPAKVNAGIRLNANGGSCEDLPDSLGFIYKGIWTAIASAAGSNLTYQEE